MYPIVLLEKEIKRIKERKQKANEEVESARKNLDYAIEELIMINCHLQAYQEALEKLKGNP